MVFHGNVVTRIVYLLFLLAIYIKQTASISVNHSPNDNGLQSVLTELGRISSSLKSIGNINEKLITNLRHNAASYGFRSRSPEDFVNQGYSCTSGIGWHKLYLSNLTWNEARKSCRKDGAHLAILNSETEAKVT